MNLGNWVPMCKGLSKYLPTDRPYSKVEAAFSIQLDIDKNARVSIHGYAKQWGWTRRRVKRFLAEMGIEIKYIRSKKAPGAGGHVMTHLPDMLREESGHVRAYDNRHLAKKADMLREESGHVADMLQHTTIETNTNTKKKRERKREREKGSAVVKTTAGKTPSPKKIKKNNYGTFGNVRLTPDEYRKLDIIFDDKRLERIDSLSEYLESTGKRYKSHYATLLSWGRKDGLINKPVDRIIAEWEDDQEWKRRRDERLRLVKQG